MKIGLVPANIGAPSGEMMLGLAQLAEQVGFESIWTFEHAIVPIDYASKYPYAESGKMGIDPDTNLVDPFIALTAIAARTQTIRLGTGVNILPQANPLYVAKQAASLDFVSNGRLELGLGIGWLREEFQAAGTPFERRGARFDDYMVALRKVWSGDMVEHDSDFIQWSGFKSYPLPVQEGGIPVIMGGSKGKIYERIAKYGDGWYIPVNTAADAVPLIEPLAAACEAVDRDPASVELTSMWTAQGGLEEVQAFADAGVERLIVPLFALGQDPVAGIGKLAEDIISKV